MVPDESPGPGGAGLPVREARCTPTRWPRPCASGPSRRASVSTTARSTPWSSRSRRRASSGPPGPYGRASVPSERLRITDDGAREMNDWMTELIGVPAKEYPAFMAGLSFLGVLAARRGAAARGAGPRRSRVGGRHAGAMKATRTPAAAIFELESEYEEQQMAAELNFVSGLVDEIDQRDASRAWRCGSAFHTRVQRRGGR